MATLFWNIVKIDCLTCECLFVCFYFYFVRFLTFWTVGRCSLFYDDPHDHVRSMVVLCQVLVPIGRLPSTIPQ